MAPHERLAIFEQLAVGFTQRFSAKQTHCVVVPLRGKSRGLARRAFDEAPREPSRRERSAGRLRDPLFDEIAARSQSQRQRVNP